MYLRNTLIILFSNLIVVIISNKMERVMREAVMVLRLQQRQRELWGRRGGPGQRVTPGES